MQKIKSFITAKLKLTVGSVDFDCLKQVWSVLYWTVIFGFLS